MSVPDTISRQEAGGKLGSRPRAVRLGRRGGACVMPTFEILVAIVAVLAGAVASVAGFGIGSLLTPLLALRTGMRLAVAVVSVPHLAGTLLRFWQLKGQVDRR